MYNSDNIVIFSDFDGTISDSDVINEFLREYADEKWLSIEKLWEDGIIGSKECLEQQLECVPSITTEQFDSFVNKIQIDNDFKVFIEKIKAKNIDFYVVSDGFFSIINKIFENNQIFDIKIISNKLELKEGKLCPSFPNWNSKCIGASGNCKCKAIEKFSSDKKKIYIGDGLSDVCAIKNADLIFAKKRLAQYCQDNSVEYESFGSFKEITEKIFKIEGNYVNS